MARRLRDTGKPITEEVHFYDSDRDYLATYSLLGRDQLITMSVYHRHKKGAESISGKPKERKGSTRRA